MAVDSSKDDSLKTQFAVREGTYLMTLGSEYSRPNRYASNQSSPQVRVSIVSLPTPTAALGTSSSAPQQPLPPPPSSYNSQIPNSLSSLNNEPTILGGDRICFNYGKEIFVYAYRGIKKADLSKPIDKKVYKGTNPSCHDFNSATATADGAPLLVGFTTGQIQLVQPGRREPGKLYNEERLIDKTKVTCLKWLPGSTNLFLASHASGHLYLYNEELPCTPAAPSYQPIKIGDGFSILTCKSKSTRNPLNKWSFGPDISSINEFCFSPSGSNMAIVSQDGFLRVFHYDTMELIGLARSYFGGFLCVCWSPDGKYIVVGGEDDLVTVWSLNEKRVVARGQGHRSWVSVVAFDPYTTSYTNWEGPEFSDDENSVNISDNYRFTNNGDCSGDYSARRQNTKIKENLAPDKLATSYRLGSVSQDTQLCLWDITEDVLRQPINFRHRLSSHDPQNPNNDLNIKLIKPTLSTQDDATHKLNSNKISSINSSSSNSDNNFVCAGSGSSSSGEAIIGARSGSVTSDKIGSVSGGTVTTAATTNSTINKNNSILDNSKNLTIGNKSNSRKSNQENQIGNCVTTTTNSTKEAPDATDSASNTITKSSTSSKSSESSTSSAGGGVGSSSGGISAFNSFTQKFSNFSFGSDKQKLSDSSTLSNQNHQHNSTTLHHHSSKKNFILPSKSSQNYNLNNHNNNSAPVDSSSLDKNSKNVLTTYDPMRLIGTSSCPRFDECPVLEPLICKKIAHERLTALIFREDCFLTACQDGFIYTWARPGSNVPHSSTSPTSQPQGSAAV